MHGSISAVMAILALGCVLSSKGSRTARNVALNTVAAGAMVGVVLDASWALAWAALAVACVLGSSIGGEWTPMRVHRALMLIALAPILVLHTGASSSAAVSPAASGHAGHGVSSAGAPVVVAVFGLASAAIAVLVVREWRRAPRSCSGSGSGSGSRSRDRHRVTEALELASSTACVAFML